MATGYSQLFSQGLALSAYGHSPVDASTSIRPSGKTSTLLPSDVAADSSSHTSLNSSSRRLTPSSTSVPKRRRRPSVITEVNLSPIAAVRSPARKAAHAFAKLIRSPSLATAAHPRGAVAERKERLGRVLPRKAPPPLAASPAPILPPRSDSAMSTLSEASFLRFERTPSPPPREPLTSHDFNSAQHDYLQFPSHAATLFPHLERHDLSAAELHNILVAPFLPGSHYPQPVLRCDRISQPDIPTGRMHPFRCASLSAEEDDEMLDDYVLC